MRPGTHDLPLCVQFILAKSAKLAYGTNFSLEFQRFLCQDKSRMGSRLSDHKTQGWKFMNMEHPYKFLLT
jgi:hypothetical protein